MIVPERDSLRRAANQASVFDHDGLVEVLGRLQGRKILAVRDHHDLVELVLNGETGNFVTIHTGNSYDHEAGDVWVGYLDPAYVRARYGR